MKPKPRKAPRSKSEYTLTNDERAKFAAWLKAYAKKYPLSPFERPILKQAAADLEQGNDP
jgi:hypothetical protein